MSWVTPTKLPVGNTRGCNVEGLTPESETLDSTLLRLQGLGYHLPPFPESMPLVTPTKLPAGNTRGRNVEGLSTPESTSSDSNIHRLLRRELGAASSGSEWSSPKRISTWADAIDGEEEFGRDHVGVQGQQNPQEQESLGDESGGELTDAGAASPPLSQEVVMENGPGRVFAEWDDSVPEMPSLERLVTNDGFDDVPPMASLERLVTNDGFDDRAGFSMDGSYSPMESTITMTHFSMAAPCPTAHPADPTQQQQQQQLLQSPQWQQLLQLQQQNQQPLPHKMMESMLRAESGHNGSLDITMSDSVDGLPLYVSCSFLNRNFDTKDKQITKHITICNYGGIDLTVLIKPDPAYLKKGGAGLKKSKGGRFSIQNKVVSDAFRAANMTMTFRIAALVASSEPVEVRGPFESTFDGVLAPPTSEYPKGEWWHLKGDRQKVTLCMEIHNKTPN